MLKQFECENFKGFSEPLIMDFSASRYDFNKSLIHHDIVSKALVYGKNGSGKSNLGIALFDIVSHLSDAKRMDNVYLQNYLCLNSKKTTARFKYTFCFQENEVVYEYHKANPDFLVSEKLTVNGKTLLNYHYLNAVPKLIDASLTGNLQIHLTGKFRSVYKF